MKRAAGYIRVSTEDQAEFSPDSQLSALKKYAFSNHIVLDEHLIFIDEGISGRNTKRRTAFNKMIAMAKTKPKPFDMILVWKYSRFARSREDSVVYKSMLRKEYGIDVISVSEPVGDDKMSVLFEAIIEAMDEYYSLNLAEEVKRGMTEKAKRGGVLSGAPFGYTVKDGKYIVQPYEAFVIKKVFSDFIKGNGYLKIAKELNEWGITTHRGNKIESRTIVYWLHNPVYIGKMRWNPTGSLSRNYDLPTAIIAQGTHAPIIDTDTWNAAQLRLKRLKQESKKYAPSVKCKVSHWLVGIARCGICNAVLSNQGGYFGCSKKARGLCSGVGYIAAKNIEKIVLNALSEIYNTTEKYLFEQENQINFRSSIGADMHCAVNKRLQRAREAYEAGIYTLDEYKQAKKHAAKDLKTVRKYVQNDNHSTDISEHPQSILQILKGDADNTEKNRLARIVFKEITLNQKNDCKEVHLIFHQ